MRTTKIKSVILCCVMCCTSVFISQAQEDTIAWKNSNESQLRIEDFLMRVDTHSKFNAVSTFIRPLNWFTRNDTLFIKLNSAFLAEKSWFKGHKSKQKKDLLLLKHEQGHFDLTEIEVRKTKKRLYFTAKNIRRNNFKSILSQYMGDQSRSNNERQILYDNETDFSFNIQKQRQWEERIQIELQELDIYKGDYVIIPFQE